MNLGFHFLKKCSDPNNDVHKKLQLLDFSKCLVERYHLDICKFLITFEKSSVLLSKYVKHYSKM